MEHCSSDDSVKSAAMHNHRGKSIILFDGVCNLCNGVVNFVLERDHNRAFLFTSLTSEAAKKLMMQFHLIHTDFDSIILIEWSSYCTKSEAALKILKGFGWYLDSLLCMYHHTSMVT
jgi:predicted DCC family thiol-disulfide oxidoreductase YuxK